MTKPEPEGVYRLTADIPINLWIQIRARAEAEDLKPTQLVRAWLAERVLDERPAVKKP